MFLKIILVSLISLPVYAHDDSQFEGLIQKWEHFLKKEGEHWLGEKFDKFSKDFKLSLTQCIEDFEKNLKRDLEEDLKKDD